MKQMFRTGRVAACLLLLVSACASMSTAASQRVDELAYFAGVRENALVGYGLVVGLDGTGDQTTQTPFTSQSLVNMLSQLGVTVPPGTNMQLRNVAAVMITANMPAFSRAGQQIDIVVSSIGNAKNLRGGTLLMTPLKGMNGEVYAMAQGHILTGGAGAQAGGASVAINQQSGGRIPRGATVERAIPLEMGADRGEMELFLRQPNFETAREMVFAINSEFRTTVASAVDAGMIRIKGPESDNERVTFIARINEVRFNPARPLPKVVFNARTGAVVMNEGVTLRRAAVSHGNLSIVIDNDPIISQPNALAGGETVVAERNTISIEQSGRQLQMLEAGADLAEVVRALNALGATPQDLMSILEALKASGSLRAELEII